MESESFSFAEVAAAREAALKELRMQAGDIPPPGWSIDPVDPLRLLSAHPCLRLRSGHLLRAYRYFWGNGGHSVVWALDEKAEFPDPAKPGAPAQQGFLEKVKHAIIGGQAAPSAQNDAHHPPKPAGAVKPAAVLEGDGSLKSYLCASILTRDLAHFGERWHSATWSGHLLIETEPTERFGQKDPWAPKAAEPAPSGPPRPPTDWKALDEKPASWKPSVTRDGKRVTVVFYTYDGQRPEGLYKHTDTYDAAGYEASREQKKIAEGMGGYIH